MAFLFFVFFCLLAYRTHQAVQPLGTTAGWMSLQLQYDLWKAEQSFDFSDLRRIEAA